MPARRGREAPVVEDAAAGRPDRRGFSKLRTRGREAPIAVANPSSRRALRVRLRAQPVPVPPSLHGTRLSRARL